MSPASAEPRQPLVLLADDDPDFLRVFADGLRRSGFDVIPALSTEEALDAASDLPRPLDILVADINLGDGWGASLALSVSDLQPEARVVYISGSAESDPVLKQAVEDHMTFLAKPFTVAELAEAMRGLLERSAAGPGAEAGEGQ